MRYGEHDGLGSADHLAMIGRGPADAVLPGELPRALAVRIHQPDDLDVARSRHCGKMDVLGDGTAADDR